jgi:DNA-binding NtrC family response regulator
VSLTSTVLGFNILMEKMILVLDADETECGELCALLNDQQFRTVPIHSLPEMITLIQDIECLVVIVDLDTVPIDNRTIRELTLKYPGLYFLCLSSERFHPHLKEALCYYIYACINKPVDPDELIYWVRSIHKNESDPNNHCKV